MTGKKWKQFLSFITQLDFLAGQNWPNFKKISELAKTLWPSVVVYSKGNCFIQLAQSPLVPEHAEALS